MNRQCEEIIRFMMDFGGLTSAEAMADLGARAGADGGAVAGNAGIC